MRLSIFSPLLLAPLVSSCAMFMPKESTNLAPDMPRVQLVRAFDQLDFDRPVWLGHDGVNRDMLYVIEQEGEIHRFANAQGVGDSWMFLDISERVFSYEDAGGHNEEGLLSMAFHPNFAQNGQFFVAYTAGYADNRRNVLSRFNVCTDNPCKADPNSECVLWEFRKPYGNHNGATLTFGPDGMLYVSYGDGGDAGDPHNLAQNLCVWFGKILRVNVDGAGYTVPADNPFVGQPNTRPEIYAYGFRNPWRMSFDGDQLWVGDVGQDCFEWVHLVKRGGNHGWSLYEGFRRFKPGTPKDDIVKPVTQYSRELGRCIIGGYVYRGQRFPELQGIYMYADFGSGRLWGLKYSNGCVERGGEILCQLKPLTFFSFGVDACNELYLTGWNGHIYRVESDITQVRVAVGR